MFLLGIDELGIYRVSGVSSDVKRLKEKFDESKFFVCYHATMMHGDDGMMAVMMVIMMVFITMMV